MTYHLFFIVSFTAFFLLAAANNNAQKDPSCSYVVEAQMDAKSEANIDLCRYELFIRTGDKPDAGTDSKIGIQFDLGDTVRKPFLVPDLAKCGGLWDPLRGDYFQWKQTDAFVLKGPCKLRECRAILMSDGSGQDPEWYVENARLKILSLGNLSVVFHGSNKIEKRLSPPNSLAVPLDLCANDVVRGAGQWRSQICMRANSTTSEI